MRFGVFTVLALIGAMVWSAGEAHAQSSRVYFAGYLGTTSFNDLAFSEDITPASGEIGLNNATSFAGALGIRLSRNFRLEGELSYQRGDVNDIELTGGASAEAGGELDSYLALLNIYYDFDVPWQVQPYIGAGVGFGFHEGEIDDIAGLTVDDSGDASGAVWQAGGGLKYRVNPELAFTGSYRYIGSTDLEFGGYEMEYNGHEFRIGLEYDLPLATAY